MSVSDLAMEKASALFAGHSPFKVGRLIGRPEFRTGSTPLLGALTNTSVPADASSVVDGVPDTEGEGSIPSIPEALSELFSLTEDGRLECRVTRFKGRTKKEEQERFVLLFAAAHEQFVGTAIQNREILSEAAKQAGLVANNDNHFRHYLSDLTNRAFSSTSDGLRLNAATRNKRLPQIIAEIFAKETEEGEKKATHKQGGRKRQSQSKEVPPAVASWLEKDISSIDGFDIGSMRSKTDQSLFAVWAITKLIKAAEAVKPAHAWIYLFHRFKKSSVSQKSLSNSLAAGKKYVTRNSNDEYFLTADGESYIESIVRGAKS